jgi:hypothetical protein
VNTGERHLNVPNTDVRNLARTLFAHNDCFFAFVHHENAPWSVC